MCLVYYYDLLVHEGYPDNYIPVRNKLYSMATTFIRVIVPKIFISAGP